LARSPTRGREIAFAAVALVAAVAASAAASDLTLTLLLGTGRFKGGEPVPIELRARHDGPGALILTFPTAQHFDVQIESAQGAIVWRWSEDQMFAQVVGRLELTPARPEVRYTVTLDGGLQPGRYRVRAWLTTPDGPPAATRDIVVE
jgi:uncharacterized protein (DUF58 family)